MAVGSGQWSGDKERRMNLLEMALTSSNSTETATDQHPEITNTNSCYPTSRVPVNGDIVSKFTYTY